MSNKLNIGVHPGIYNAPEVLALREKGHGVHLLDDMADFDVILGPNAWRMTPELFPYIDLSLKQARAIKKEKKKNGS